MMELLRSLWARLDIAFYFNMRMHILFKYIYFSLKGLVCLVAMLSYAHVHKFVGKHEHVIHGFTNQMVVAGTTMNKRLSICYL